MSTRDFYDHGPERPDADASWRAIGGGLWRRVARYPLPLFGAAGALVAAAGSVLGFGIILRLLIDRGLATGASSDLAFVLAWMGILVAVMGVAVGLRIYWVSWLGERVVADLRREVFDRVLHQPPAFFATERIGELISRLTADTAVLQTVIPTSLTTAIRNVLLVVGGLALMLWTSAWLTLVLLVGLPLLAVPIWWLARRVRARSREAQERVGVLAAFVDESLHAVETLQAFTLETPRSTAHAEAAEAARQAANRRNRAGAWLAGGAMLWMFLLVLLLLWLGGNSVQSGQLTGGELAAFLFFSVLVAGAAAVLGEQISELARAMGAAERLLHLAALPTPELATAFADDGRRPGAPKNRDTGHLGDRSAGHSEGHSEGHSGAAGSRGLEFENVRFHYPGREAEPALDLDRLIVAPGERVALVGPSGAGKSTLFRLLLRFHDPERGTIHWDGVDIGSRPRSWIRRRIGWVPQDVQLLNGTIRDNVQLGEQGIESEAVDAALRAAHAWEFVERLPEGPETRLGERGVGLSGGQKARIALARAFLRAPAILLLDEATSALDAESERLVQQSLDHWSQGRTTLTIAHRLATVQRADRILVFEQGRVIASGTHVELLESSPLYQHLAALQFLPEH